MNRHRFPRTLFLLPVFLLACTRTRPATTTAPDALAERPALTQLPESVDAEALESTASTLQSKVTHVTVFSDRARVTRQARGTVGPAPTVLAFRKLPGWVDDGSVRVAADVGRIVDVRVERNFLAEATDDTYKAADAAHQELIRKLAALDDELAVLDAQRAQIERIKAFSVEKITQDTLIGEVSVDAYGDVLSFITESLRGTAQARRDVAVQRAELQPLFDASQRHLADVQNLMKLEETTVYVTLQGPEGASEATVDVTYMLPGATWEPVHELRVAGGTSSQVEVVSFAQVTQTSGEDWGKAKLSFSTQSSTQSVRIPELEALTLGDTHTADRILTSKISSFTRAQQAYEGQNALWNSVQHRGSSMSERSSFEQTYKRNVEYLQVVQGKTVQIFETLQRRGTSSQFEATATQPVRGDGHPVRMRIGSARLEATEAIVAVPEQSLNAARTLDLMNSTGQTLLPGNVALYRDGTFLGMTEMDFVAEGERFSLFLGVADHVKLARKLDRKRSSLIRKRRNRMEVAFIVSAENLSGETTTFRLADRIPVSENKDIRVERVKIAPSVVPDSRGLLGWNVTLQPQERREYRISYVVDYPSELVIEARRRRSAEASSGAKHPFKKRAKYRIEEQLADLEDDL